MPPVAGVGARAAAFRIGRYRAAFNGRAPFRRLAAEGRVAVLT